MPTSELFDAEGKVNAEEVAAMAKEITGEGAAPEHPEHDPDGRKPADAAKPSNETAQETAGEEVDDADRGVTPWMSAKDVRDLAESLGLTDTDLKEFQTEDDFFRAAALTDKALRKVGRDSQKAGEPEKPAPEREPEKPKPGKTRGPDGKFLPAGEEDYQVGLDPDVYDEGVVNEFNKLSAHFQARVQQMDKLLREVVETNQRAEHRRMVRDFDSCVDQLDMPELFGKGEEVTKEDRDRRGKVWGALCEILHGAAGLGRPTEISLTTVRRAANSEFAEDIKQRARRQLSDRIQKSSRQRLGSPNGRAPAEKQWEGPPHKNPKLLALYRQMTQEGGGA